MITALTVVGGLVLFSVGLALAIGKGIALGDAAICAPQPEETRQPDDRDWICSDGNLRTAAEATDWCAATPGSDAYWLDAWIFGETVPDYVPQDWVA